MKVLLLSDVYKLGRAGDVKKVADGYGRNYLIPQGMAVLATPGALKQVEHIKAKATVQRAIINKEMDAIAQRLNGGILNFTMKASETGKLYGSVTHQMLVEALKDKLGVDIARRQIDVQPIRTLGEFKVNIRLTVDLIPAVKVFVYREGEAILTQTEAAVPAATAPDTAVAVADTGAADAAVDTAADKAASNAGASNAGASTAGADIAADVQPVDEPAAEPES